MTQEPNGAPRSPLGPAFVLALVGSFLAFSAVMLVTLLYLVLMGGSYEAWVRPLTMSARLIAGPFAAVVFVFTLVMMYRRMQSS